MPRRLRCLIQKISILPPFMTSIHRTAADGALWPQASKSSMISVRLWLGLIAACVFAMVLVGGATRLTGSGLSITEWQPILGAFPPTSQTDWLDAFHKYQQIPEYQLINKGMTLAEFKAIYWWEWSHRLLGRLIGFIFFAPFVYFLWRRAIPKPFIGRIGLLFIFGRRAGAAWLADGEKRPHAPRRRQPISACGASGACRADWELCALARPFFG